MYTEQRYIWQRMFTVVREWLYVTINFTAAIVEYFREVATITTQLSVFDLRRVTDPKYCNSALLKGSFLKPLFTLANLMTLINSSHSNFTPQELTSTFVQVSSTSKWVPASLQNWVKMNTHGPLKTPQHSHLAYSVLSFHMLPLPDASLHKYMCSLHTKITAHTAIINQLPKDRHISSHLHF
jgi:hypothetical protein